MEVSRNLSIAHSLQNRPVGSISSTGAGIGSIIKDQLKGKPTEAETLMQAL